MPNENGDLSMKVCDIVKNSVWYDPRVRKQIDAYLQNGVDVCCVGIEDGRYQKEKVDAVACPVYLASNKSAFRKIPVLSKIWRETVVNRRLCRILLREKPDVIHANDLNALVPAYKAAKKLGCRVVYDSHEVFLENVGVINSRINRWIWTYYEKKLVHKIDRMVCVSHAAADYFAEKYKIEKPLVVTNCSLLSEQSVSAEKHDGFEVLNHGQYYAGRGYDIMMEAIPLLRDHPSVKLALRGFGKMEEALRARATELGDENVRFYPPVLVQELIPQASLSHVGVAITEGICLNFKLSVSNKLFEYASAGLPVIMSDIPEHRYLNEKYRFGIILPENTPSAFADAVIRLYSDEDLYLTCAEGAKRLTQEVNWECEFARLIELERSWLHGS